MMPNKEQQLVELEKVFPQAKAVIDKVFGGQVKITLKHSLQGDPSISAEYSADVSGIDISVVEMREQSELVPVYQLTQTIPLPFTVGVDDADIDPIPDHDHPDFEIDEIGDYIRWQGCLYKMCEIIAACLATQVMDDLETAQATVEWQHEMDEFFETRVAK